jgi:hypothetical protein
VYRRLPGSGTAKQRKKKDLYHKSSSATSSRRWKNLYPMSTTPNRGAKLEGEGLGRGENDSIRRGGRDPLFLEEGVGGTSLG